jgi:CheY-like chemotaxis protein
VTDWYLAQTYYYQGGQERAEKILTDLRGSAQAGQRAKATLASFLAARHEKGRAEKLLEEVLAGSYQDHHVHYSVGVAYAQLGDKAKARQLLARALQPGFLLSVVSARSASPTSTRQRGVRTYACRVEEKFGGSESKIRVKSRGYRQCCTRIINEWKPDSLVSDIGMPTEDGYELSRPVRALGPESGGTMAAVALTGYARKRMQRALA